LRRAAGFTLIEVSVVMLLISIFAFLAIPRLNFSGSDRLSATAKRLSNTSRYLINEAALTGREHRLVYDLEHGSYRAMILEADGELTTVGGPGKLARLHEDVRFRDLTLPGRGTFSTGEVVTRIYPAGWQEETIVHLVNRQGEQLTVRLSPLTGLAETYEGYREFR
jgi:general secretion pathway protein H